MTKGRIKLAFRLLAHAYRYVRESDYGTDGIEALIVIERAYRELRHQGVQEGHYSKLINAKHSCSRSNCHLVSFAIRRAYGISTKGGVA